MSVPRVGGSCFTRKAFGGGPFLSRPLSSPGDKTVAPTSRDEFASPPPLAEGGPPALGWTHGRTGPPCGPTEGGAAAGAAGSGDFAPRPRRRPGRERGGGRGPRAGSRSGRTRISAAPAGRREGGRRGFHPGTRTRTSAFSSPRFLKAKAIIYRPFRFAACSLRELDIQAPPEREGGAGAGDAPAAAEEAVRGGRSRDPPARPARDRAARRGRRARPPFFWLKSTNLPAPPAPPPSRTDPVASPPAPVLKGPAERQPMARRGRGVGAPRAGGSTDSGRARPGAGSVGVAS